MAGLPPAAPSAREGRERDSRVGNKEEEKGGPLHGTVGSISALSVSCARLEDRPGLVVVPSQSGVLGFPPPAPAELRALQRRDSLERN